MELAFLARRHPTTLALATATFMIAQQVAGKATRDALFLSQFDVVHLPKVVIGGALISLAGVLGMSALLTRFGPARTVPAAFAASALLFVAEWASLKAYPGFTAVLLYLHMTGFGAIVISGFWSLINERFDPHSAKPRIARIAAGAALGGVLGGLLANFVAGSLGFRSMLVLLALLNLGCAGVVGTLGIGARADAPADRTKMRSGLEILRRSAYLRNMASLLTLIAVMAALLDYALKAEAARHFVSREPLVAFFAAFYAIAGLVSFLLQSMLGPRLLERFGIGPALATLPLVVLAGGLTGSFAVRLATVALLRGAHTVLVNSLFRSAFELLYAPLPAHAKRSTKPIIDVAADRVGDILGGGLILLLLAIAPQLPIGLMVLLAAAVAVGALTMVSRLNRGYVEQLARTLRSGAMSMDEQEVVDATTRRILAETSAAAERHKVLERIKQLKRDRASALDAQPAPIYGGSDELPPASRPGRAPTSLVAEPVTSDLPLARATADLCSSDPARIRHALTGDFMDLRLVPHLIPLLDHDEVAEDARMELRWLVPRIIGQLTDALLEPDLPITVRQRIPGVMEICHNPRVVEALLLGLTDGEFNVRYSSARALARMRSRDSNLRIPTATVYGAVRREVGVDRETWQTRSLGAWTDGGDAGADELPVGAGPTLSLDHVFTLLGLVLDRDALQLALQALSSDDPNLRGTALEYLDNVLPDDLRRKLSRHLGLTVSTLPRSRRGAARPTARAGGDDS